MDPSTQRSNRRLLITQWQYRATKEEQLPDRFYIQCYYCTGTMLICHASKNFKSKFYAQKAISAWMLGAIFGEGSTTAILKFNSSITTYSYQNGKAVSRKGE